MNHNLLSKATLFVKKYLLTKLPRHMYFHNYQHTLMVADSVKIIAKEISLNRDETFIITLSALFHDIGYVFQYLGHEEASTDIASHFLLKNGLSSFMIEAVQGCILATKMPQGPKNEMEMAICDSDLYHFSLPDYQHHALLLRREWQAHRKLYFSESDWNSINLEVLQSHAYHTTFGKDVLQKRKEGNINFLQELLKG